MYFKKHIVLFLFGLLIAGVQLSAQQLAGITFIGNSLGVKTLTTYEVLEYYKARRNLWPSNKAVIACLPPSKTQEATDVCAKIYGKSVAEVQKFWLSEVFKGRSRSPYFALSDEDLLEYVSSTPGAIGAFINERNLAIPQELQLQIKP
jgi:hypothetical protein